MPTKMKDGPPGTEGELQKDNLMFARCVDPGDFNIRIPTQNFNFLTGESELPANDFIHISDVTAFYACPTQHIDLRKTVTIGKDATFQ